MNRDATPAGRPQQNPSIACAKTHDGPVADDDYCYLTTTGRRSGRTHRIEIWYAVEGTTLYLLAGGGRSADWVQNLKVDPAVLVELNGIERPARARVIADGD